ncbi:MAG: hypothetical protein SGARI_000083 [Bacillariaceae sp.]
MDDAMAAIQKEVTADVMLQDIENRVENHDHASSAERMALIQAVRATSSSTASEQTAVVTMERIVGPKAAQIT